MQEAMSLKWFQVNVSLSQYAVKNIQHVFQIIIIKIFDIRKTVSTW